MREAAVSGNIAYLIAGERGIVAVDLEDMAGSVSAFDPRTFLKAARAATAEICRDRYEAFGAAGMASRIRPIPVADMARMYAS